MATRISILLSKLRPSKSDDRWFLGYGRNEDKPVPIHWVMVRDMKTREVVKAIPCFSANLAQHEKAGLEKLRASGDERLNGCIVEIEPLPGIRNPASRAA